MDRNSFTGKLNDGHYILAGLAICTCLLLYAETISPYTFLKDDNYAQFLPSTLEGLHQLFSGTLPVLNSHQTAGLPLLQMSTYPVLYPLTWAAYAIANLLGNEYLLFEIFVALHLLLGFIATYVLLRKTNTPAPTSLIGAIGATMSGYLIIVSSNWFYAAPTALYLPLMLLLAKTNFEKPEKKTAILSGIVRALYFLSGNLQYFVLTCFFELVYVALLALERNSTAQTQSTRQETNSRLAHYIASIAITAVLCLPLGMLFVQNMGDSYGRMGLLGMRNYLLTPAADPVDFVLGNILPYPLYGARNTVASAPAAFSNIYYTGTILFLAALAAGAMLFKKHGKATLTKYPFATLAILATLLSFGIIGIIYLLMTIVPIWNKFSSPFKFTLYADFFIAAFGAQALALLLEKIQANRRTMATAAIAVVFTLAMFLNVHYSSQVPFTDYQVQMPINAEEFAQYRDGRIIDYSTASYYTIQLRSLQDKADAKYDESVFMTRDFATYYGLYSISGYEPLQSEYQVTKLPGIAYVQGYASMPVGWLSEWGVKYVFIPCDSLKYHPELWKMPINTEYADKGLLIAQNNQAKPLAFCNKTSDVKYNLTDNGMQITIQADRADNCTATLVYNKNYAVTINGAAAKPTPDTLGRITFQIQEGKSTVSIRYENKILLYAGALAIAMLACLLLFYGRAVMLAATAIDFATQKKVAKILAIIVLATFLLILAQEMLKLSPQETFDCATGNNLNFSAIRKCVRDGLIGDNAIRPDITALNSLSTHINVTDPAGTLHRPSCQAEMTTLDNLMQKQA